MYSFGLKLRLTVVRHVAKKLQTAWPQKNRLGHYCELFMCRNGFAILGPNYAQLLFVLFSANLDLFSIAIIMHRFL